MSIDLSSLLEEWPYEPGQINVRIIEGDDGEPKIQMRLDLGVLQMEAFGRPDGQRPQHCESLLEYYESVLDDYMSGSPPPGGVESSDSLGLSDPDGPAGNDADADDPDDAGELPGKPSQSGGERRNRPKGSPESGPGSGGAGSEPGGPDAASPDEIDFTLSSDDCRQLREEAVQYYHRYISLLVLGDYAGVLRDTTRNLRVLNLCRDYAESEEDREVLEQFRPYLTMMRTRAVASQAIADDEPKAALWAIEDGLEQLRKLYDDADRSGEYEAANEVQLLRGMRDELVKKLPASQKSELRKRLQEAIERENYELAAILRDELRMLKE